jgi:hypothetical protein
VPLPCRSAGRAFDHGRRKEPGLERRGDRNMKYVCLAYEDEGKLNALSATEWEDLRQETVAYVEKLTKSGHHLSSAALESIEMSTTVRVRSGKVLTTDGPFAETKEQLGGVIFIEAEDLDEAIEIAANWPSARFGSIEVRPILEQLREGSRYGRTQ